MTALISVVVSTETGPAPEGSAGSALPVIIFWLLACR